MKKTKEILAQFGFDSLNPMQVELGKNIQKNDQIVLLSPTGSGKTLGFLLPLLELIDSQLPQVQCLILTPSRELALQIEQVWKKMATGIKVNVCYGGHAIQVELRNLSTPPAVLIGTPGRIMDHLHRQSFSLEDIQVLILDEFDKSLEMGFHEQMQFIIENIPHLQKKILVSATQGVDIPDFTGILQPHILDFLPNQEPETKALCIKKVISEEKDKVECLFRLICSLNSEAALIFCNHREAAERTSDFLKKNGIIATFYHGGMEQEERERALIQFRNGSINYLVCTDLAARGLDISEMKHVIHYHLPNQEQDFIHRNGRTARMYGSGTAYLMVHKDEKISEFINKDIEEYAIPEIISLPNLPQYRTIYVGGGKKNKINKIDIVGFLCQKGNIEKSDIGMIEVKDFNAFVAVKYDKASDLLKIVKHEKIKGKKYKIDWAK